MSEPQREGDQRQSNGPAGLLCQPSGVPNATAAQGTPAGRRRATVLLAEDEVTVRDVVSRLLTSVGCAVVVATNGEEAIDRYRRHAGEIDLALIDLTMPRLGGEAVARELRRLSAGLQIVLMSGYPEQEKAAQLADLRLAGYLQKPFRLPALLEALDRVLPQ